ncbi:MAG: hypothetical protein WC365_03170 [Candidatus Babeliales bacterium]|jgi:hypothetical protein
MKQTLRLLLALMIGHSMPMVCAQQVPPSPEREFGQENDLIIDPAAFEQLDAIEKNTSLTKEIRMIARCALEYAKVKAVKFKDTASVHVKEHKKAYIAGFSVTAALILLWWLRHMYASKSGVQPSPNNNKPLDMSVLTDIKPSDVPHSTP